jgi:hypothetical protein
MFRDVAGYHAIDPEYFARRDKDRVTKRLLQRLRDLDVAVEVKVA